MAARKGHYRVDAVRRSGEDGTEAETVETMASGLTYKEAKQTQKALYEKYGYGGPLFFRPVRETGRRKKEAGR